MLNGNHLGAYKAFSQFHAEDKLLDTDRLFMKHATMIIGSDVGKLTQIAKIVQDNSPLGQRSLTYGMDLLNYAMQSKEFLEAKAKTAAVANKNREASR